MSNAVIFNGAQAKALKAILSINDNMKVITGESDDPTAVAKDAPLGSLYIKSDDGVAYIKKDAGSTTNWMALNAASEVLSALDIDWNKSAVFEKSIAAGETYTFSNDDSGMVISVALTNTSGGTITVNFPAAEWPGGTAITDVEAGDTAVFTFIKVGSTVYANAVEALS